MHVEICRYIAIYHHVYHRNKLTPRVCAVINALIWTVSAIIGMLPLMGWNVLDKTSQTFGGNHGAPLSTLMFIIIAIDRGVIL